jgi:hypothetical protein
MRNNFKKILKKYDRLSVQETEFPVSDRMPLPIRRVDYNVLLRLLKVLEGLPDGSSFPIKCEHAYAVRKLSHDYHPEYKITVRNTGNSHRVFRVA